MSLLLDTNILTRSAQPSHPMHEVAVQSVSILKDQGEDLCVVPQNLTEFWAVATRPMSANGMEMSTTEAHSELIRIKSFFRLLPDLPALYDEWERIVAQHAVSGKNAYDARIVAAMSIHRINRLLTFNGDDFKRYREINVMSPNDITERR